MQVKDRALDDDRQVAVAAGEQVAGGTGAEMAPRPSALSRRLADLRSEQDMDDASLIRALREQSSQRLGPDERLEGMFYAWSTGESEPSSQYRHLLGKVFGVPPAQFSASGVREQSWAEASASKAGVTSGNDLSADAEDGAEGPWHHQMRKLRREQGLSKSELVAALRERAPQPISSDDELMFHRVVRWERGKDVPSEFFQDLLGDVLGAPSATFAPPIPGAGDASVDGGNVERLAPPWSERVATLRSEQNVSRAELVESLRESAGSQLCSDEELYSRIAGWESGKHWPSSYFCDLLGDVFQVPADEFVNPIARPDQLADPGLSDGYAPVAELADDDEDGWEL